MKFTFFTITIFQNKISRKKKLSAKSLPPLSIIDLFKQKKSYLRVDYLRFVRDRKTSALQEMLYVILSKIIGFVLEIGFVTCGWCDTFSIFVMQSVDVTFRVLRGSVYEIMVFRMFLDVLRFITSSKMLSIFSLKYFLFILKSRQLWSNHSVAI